MSAIIEFTTITNGLKALGAVLSRTCGGRPGQPDGGRLGRRFWRGLMLRAPISNSPDSLSGETELAVWDSVIDSLRFIDDQHGDSPQREAFRVYARKLLWTAFSRLGWQPQPGEETEADAAAQSPDCGARGAGRSGGDGGGPPQVRRACARSHGRASGAARADCQGRGLFGRSTNLRRTFCAWRASRRATRSA